MAGVVQTDEALRRARDVGMDLVEVSPAERPPVCKIMDYGKFKYSQSKSQKHKHHEQKLKEVRMRPKTDAHDRLIKVEHAKQWLEHGDRVQFTMVFKGRERQHQDLGYKALIDIMKELDEVAKVERAPKMEGGRLSMVLVPAKAAPPPTKKPSKPADAKPKPKPAAAPISAAAVAPAAAPEPAQPSS